MSQSSHSGHSMPSFANASKSQTRALKISAWLTGIYFIIEMAIGIYTGSVAVISDAFHTFSAVGGVLVAIFASRMAGRIATSAKTFGWYRAEIIGALVNGVFLLLMAILVIYMGIMRLGNPLELPTGPMLWAAAGGLVTEVISLYLLTREKTDDLNMRGAFWHVMQTFVGSVLIIIAALVIEFTGFLAIDPILGTAFGFVLLWASWGIIRDAMHLLMEGTPDDVQLPHVIAALSQIKGVSDVHHVHAWALTSGRYVFSTHLLLDKKTRIKTDTVLKAAHKLLKEDFGFYFATVQVETARMDEKHSTEIDVESSGGDTKHSKAGAHDEHKGR
ncbi:MAG: cation diffusion facilitator family transporter [Devosiaceae bacterium]|nr:cation diffusion facilitator family transporter [Devosiaceae bacterium]